jgi:hypothetical protein
VGSRVDVYSKLGMLSGRGLFKIMRRGLTKESYK